MRVWEADIAAGVDIPIRIHVCEGSDGHTYARYREPSKTFAPYDNDALSALGAELDPIFERIVEGGDRAASDPSDDLRERRVVLADLYHGLSGLPRDYSF